MTADPHQISMKEAIALTQRWRDTQPTGSIKGARFDRIAFDNLLAQPGCAGIRIYLGLHTPDEVPPGTSLWTYVMIGTDAEGNDMIPVKLDDSDTGPKQLPLGCPPFCDIKSPLNAAS
jgi:hypothetical protein